MSVLHGGWLGDGGFFLWGEMWRRWAGLEAPSASPPEHPFGMTIALDVPSLTKGIKKSCHARDFGLV